MTNPADPRRGRAALVAVGDELVRGEQRDANLSWLAERLAEHDLLCDELRLIGDDEDALADALAELCETRELVVTTGGLGPTLDDVTRHAAARAAGRGLVRDDESLAVIRAFFESRGREMAASNERQALMPEGAVALPNPVGTAPGFRVPVRGGMLVVLPGPPREMQTVYATALEPWLAGREREGARAGTKFLLHGLSESVFSDMAGDWMERGANPRMGVLAGRGMLQVKFEARAARPSEATAILDARRAEFAERFAEWVLHEGREDSIAPALARFVIEHGLTVATAESCTGGLVAELLTREAGVSASFLQGFVTYSNASKTNALGVPPELIESAGAVSEDVAGRMAAGAAERAGTDLAVAVSGIAGPDGGTPEKPVGTVCFGLSARGALTTLTRHYPARGREFVREWAAQEALVLLYRAARELARA
ncbi:MAG: CinA family nicotinamide mononucleotide deamidase-related protein [Planctomycetes bacterium]|nr:CinA family nicotinamide mononucleotide deamidase-related protein [Planctomycetota bacterium]